MEEIGAVEFVRRESDRELLRRRAEQLARKVADAGEHHGSHATDYVKFTMGRDSYGIETVHIKEVLEPEDIVPVPCTPDYLVGVVSVRGHIWAVIDLCRFWGKGAAVSGSRAKIVLLAGGENEFALVVDEVSDVVPVYDYEQKAMAEGHDAVARYASAVTEDRMILLRGRSLLEESAFVINEFVGNI
ncbi:chemotaxis protein CheW [Maridesulfovibrio sp. FT414]|uniref:chemotaxis protein CheW n=1 Tax=Maridesulfovibrio sp. FT414 TaxID=2979469 RepID=UPI003D800BC8